jgi:hypothetical protein
VTTIIDGLRDYLADADIVRRPNTAGPGDRPWLPPAWKHPDVPVAPGDVPADANPVIAGDDGLVVSLMRAPGIVMPPGAEQRRIDGIDIILRGNAVPQIDACEAAIRRQLLGDNPGGMTDFMMGDVYVIQTLQFRPYAPVDATGGIYTFIVGYTVETIAT